jgi:molybdopterin synthase sulfur carrier subunit
MTTAVIRVEIPYHLQTLARVGSEISLEVEAPITACSIVDAIEARYPMLCGTIRDHVTKQRRPFLRYFGCQRDLSHDPADKLLPEAIVSGAEPFIIWGAIAGG